MTHYIAAFRSSEGEQFYVSEHRLPPDMAFWIGNMYLKNAFVFDSVEAALGGLAALHYGPDQSCVFQQSTAGDENLRRVWPLSALEQLALEAP